MQVSIRKATETDLPELRELIQRTNRISFKELYTQALMEAFCSKYELDKLKERIQNMDLYIALDESEKILGVIGIKDNMLRTFFVDPAQQGRGIGRKLYDHFETLIRKAGYDKITLESSPIAKPIYEHFGFQSLGEVTKERAGESYQNTLMEKAL